MMKLTIRKKVLFCSLIPLLLLGGIILLIASTIVKGAIIDQVENSLKGTAIATQAAYDQNAGTYLQTENGDIWKGSYNISQSGYHQTGVWDGGDIFLWITENHDFCSRQKW